MKKVTAVLLGLTFLLIPVSLHAGSRASPRRVAILEFQNVSADREFSWLSVAVPETLTTKLAAVRDLSLIERRQIEKVIREQRIQLSDLVDPSTAVKVGRLSGAQVVVLGSFLRMGHDLLFNLRFVDVETGVVLHTAQVQAETSSGKALFSGLNRLADAAIEALEKRVVVNGSDKEVVRKARLPTTPEERNRLHTPPAKSLDAYALYGQALEQQKKGRWREAAALLERATEKDEAFANAFLWLGVARMRIGQMEMGRRRIGQMDRAKDASRRALALYREKGSEAQVALTLFSMGVIDSLQGRNGEAMTHYQESLATSRRLGNETVVAAALHGMGGIHSDQRQYEEAMRLYKASLAINRLLGDEAGEAETLLNMGFTHDSQAAYKERKRFDLWLGCHQLLADQKQRRSEEALRRYDNCLASERRRRLADEAQVSHKEALRLYKASLAIKRRLGDEAGEADTLHTMAGTHSDLDRYKEAMRLYKASLAIRRRLGDQAGVAKTLNSIAGIHVSQEKYCEALSIKRKLGLAKDVKYLEALIRALRVERPDLALSCSR